MWKSLNNWKLPNTFLPYWNSLQTCLELVFLKYSNLHRSEIILSRICFSFFLSFFSFFPMHAIFRYLFGIYLLSRTKEESRNLKQAVHDKIVGRKDLNCLNTESDTGVPKEMKLSLIKKTMQCCKYSICIWKGSLTGMKKSRKSSYFCVLLYFYLTLKRPCPCVFYKYQGKQGYFYPLGIYKYMHT